MSLSLRQGTIVDTTIIHAPSSTKNEDGKRYPEMHQSQKGNPHYLGMKAHIGAYVESGRVHHAHGTAASVANATQVAELLHGEENAGSWAQKPDEAVRTGLSALSNAESRFRFD